MQKMLRQKGQKESNLLKRESTKIKKGESNANNLDSHRFALQRAKNLNAKNFYHNPIF